MTGGAATNEAEVEDALIERWVALFDREQRAQARAAGVDLMARYAQPHRRYHTVRHLREVLAIVDELESEADDADAVRMAAWFHDAIYQVRLGEPSESVDESSGSATDGDAISNEEASARLAERVLAESGVPAARVAETARLVRVTQTHRIEAGDRNAAVLCDADLAVLGAPDERYRQYTLEVRQEYARVPDEDFRRGRAEILQSLLAAPTLFHTAVAGERYERRARVNLAAEIAALTGR